MLHTLHSLASMEENSNLMLDQQHYTVFDSRTFCAELSIEDTFTMIRNDFIRLWNNSIKPFIDALMYSHNVYKVDPNKSITLIPEEGIYLSLQNLSRNNIAYFYRNKEIRLIGLDIKDDSYANSSLSVFNSAVYDPLAKGYYCPISIVFYKRLLSDIKDNNEVLNRILLRIVHTLATSFIDTILMDKYKVAVNRCLAANAIDSNKDIILLPESFNLTDIRFIYSYFYTLFDILTHILNDTIIDDFSDYSSVISLPDIFEFNMTDEEASTAEEKIKYMTEEEANRYALGYKQKIYRKIWDYAKKSEYYTVSDPEYIQLCTDIFKNLSINFNEMYYQAQAEEDEEKE